MDPSSSSRAESYESTSAMLMRRHRGFLALGASPFAAGMALITAAVVSGNYKLLAALGHCFIFGLLGLAFAYKQNPRPVFMPGKVTADPTGVKFDGSMVAARDEIKDGFVMPYKGNTVVRLVRKGTASNVHIAVESVDDGRRLLRALGLDASQTVAHIRTLSRTFAMTGGKQMAIFMLPVAAIFVAMFASAAIFGARHAPIGMAILPLVYAFIFTMTLSATHVEIGADGILTKWFGRQRYFPFSEIEWVNPWEGGQLSKRYVGVELVLRSGEHYRILTGQKRWEEDKQAMLLERIREAIETYKSGTAGADASVLARAGLAPKDWIARLRGLGAGANADMRTPPIPHERLWRVIEDPSAPPVARASAAIALAPQVPPAERRRIRVAAETTASPKLRIALERACEKDIAEEELAEAMTALESESEHA